MERTELKKKLFDTCRKLQLQRIENLNKVVVESQQSANEYGAPKDRYDAYRTQLLRKRDMFAQQLLQAKEDMDHLERIDPEKEDPVVEIGSAVITDKQKIFISISLGKIETEGQSWYAVSPKVPIYNALKGKKQGDVVIFNNNKLTLVDVF